MLEKVISKARNAFIKGSQIFLIANKCLDSKIRSQEPGMLCNLDLEKAYDLVNWSFLLYMLGRSGFREI